MIRFINRFFCKHEYHLKASYRVYTNGKVKRKDVYICYICGKTKIKYSTFKYSLKKVRV